MTSMDDRPAARTIVLIGTLDTKGAELAYLRDEIVARGARTLVEAAEIGKQLQAPEPVALPVEAEPTLDRFVELRGGAETPDEADARAIVRELKAVGGDLRVLRLALTGAERGPELWTVVAALSRDEALRRVRRARSSG